MVKTYCLPPTPLSKNFLRERILLTLISPCLGHKWDTSTLVQPLRGCTGKRGLKKNIYILHIKPYLENNLVLT